MMLTRLLVNISSAISCDAMASICWWVMARINARHDGDGDVLKNRIRPTNLSMMQHRNEHFLSRRVPVDHFARHLEHIVVFLVSIFASLFSQIVKGPSVH